MNALDLPPRRTLPDETRDRIRRSIDTGIGAARRRFRAPLAAAAAVALLAVGAVVVARWAPEGVDTPSPAATAPDRSVAQPVTTGLPDRRTGEDLDHCADVVATSPRATDFRPRSEWRPKFTATAPDGARITAFLGGGVTPTFCEVTATTATVTDPTGGWIVLGDMPSGTHPASIHAGYLSPAGVLVGVANGVDGLEFSIVRDRKPVPVGVPAFRDGLFVVNLGECGTDEYVNVVGRNSRGLSVVTGMVSCTAFPPPAATGPIG